MASTIAHYCCCQPVTCLATAGGCRHLNMTFTVHLSWMPALVLAHLLPLTCTVPAGYPWLAPLCMIIILCQVHLTHYCLLIRDCFLLHATLCMCRCGCAPTRSWAPRHT
jgi:hypothetical protein